ncbi:MAG: glycoside hydrolase, catalytic core [Mucilaginibacter sp.]|nr:glycoside hydrolase, catalytic core [Mucilaginibacter sp.]
MLVVLCAAAQILHAQNISTVKLITAKPQLYTKTEFDIGLTADWQNPYLQEDVALDMILHSPSGKKQVLPCYYESGESGKESLWKARFAPREKGKYTYNCEFSKAGHIASRSKEGSFTVEPSGKNGFLHLKNNWEFQFDNGKPFRGIGENIGWESRKSDDSKFFSELHQKPKYDYEYMLPALAAHGGNFFRTWICSFNLPLDWHRDFNSNRYEPSDAYYNPSAIRKIDRMFNLCDSLGLYVMLTLGAGNYNIHDGGFSPSAADFFVNPKSKERYKNRLRYFVARWGYSTSVGAWEFFNEVDNVQFGNKNKPINADSIVNWHDEMSTYLKNIDPYDHLTTTSISHRDLKGLDALPHMDFNQKHIYKNTTAIPQAITQYEQNFNKPYVIGEYSYEWDWSKNFDDFVDEMDSDYKRGLWYGLFTSTPILPMSWWWEYFDNRKTDEYLKKIRGISDRMLAAGNGSFEQVAVTSSAEVVITYGVKCGNKTFVYAYNPSSTEQKISLAFDFKGKPVNGEMFDCESGVTKRIAEPLVVSGQMKTNIALPAKGDVILIVGGK